MLIHQKFPIFYTRKLGNIFATRGKAMVDICASFGFINLIFNSFIPNEDGRGNKISFGLRT